MMPTVICGYSNIHYPTDAKLILDGIGRMRNLVCLLVILFPILAGYQRGHWWGSPKKVYREIQRLAAKEKGSCTEKMKGFYLKLIELALRLTIRCEETIEGAKKHMKREGSNVQILGSLLREECVHDHLKIDHLSVFSLLFNLLAHKRLHFYYPRRTLGP